MNVQQSHSNAMLDIKPKINLNIQGVSVYDFNDSSLIRVH